MQLRPGNAGSNTATDHITVTKDALKQLPAGHRSGRKVMIRTDSAGGTHGFLHWLSAKHRNLGYTVGFPNPRRSRSGPAQDPEESLDPGRQQRRRRTRRGRGR